VDRRTFLRGAGIGGVGAAVIGTEVAAYAVGHEHGESHIVGINAANVRAGQREGHVNIWWSVTTEAKALALTFDDGPTEQFTGPVLDILDRYRVPATFFMIGNLVTRLPDHVRRVLDAGHEVANHTFDHYSAAKQPLDEVRRTVARGADAIAAISGERPRWFRPVKGHVTGALLAAASEVGHDLALWSVSRDPGIDTPLDDVDGVRRNFLDALHEGAIVIFHDGIGRSAFDVGGPDEELVTARTAEIAALPDVIEAYLADGYELLTVSDLIDRHSPLRPSV
jgi:peptidoglycan-N-acetylglucosamine deacetylase